MAYVDANFNVQIQDTVIGGSPSNGVSLGTVTASATQTYTGTGGKQVNGTFQLPVFKNPVKILGIRVYCGATGVGGGVTGLTLGFYNGTSLLGSVAAPATNTFTDCTLVALTTDSHGLVTGPTLFTNTTSNEVIMINTATGTASGSALGSYTVDMIWQNLFVS